MAKPSGQMADKRLRQFDQPVCYASRVHDVGSHQEKRHGEQHKGVIGFEHLIHQQKRGQPILDDEDRNAGKAEGKSHRYPQNYQNAEIR